MCAPTQDSLFDPLELGGVAVDSSVLPSVELHPAVAAWFRERFPRCRRRRRKRPTIPDTSAPKAPTRPSNPSSINVVVR